MVDIQLLNVDAPRWSELLADQRHDFYHLPGYVRLCAELSQGRAVAFDIEHAGARLFLPVILHTIPGEEAGGFCDAESPYGYPGPLLRTPPEWSPEARDGFVGEALAAMLGKMRALRLVSSFIRLHPLLPLATGPLLAVGALVHHGDTVSLDLAVSEAALWQQIRGNHRTGINRSLRLGHQVEFDSCLDQFEVFLAAYHQTMVRVGAKPSYFFPREYYHRLHQALGGRLHLVLVRVDGVPASVALFTEVDGIVQYHLGGTFDEFLRLHTHKLLFHSVALWARARGNRCLHLGGGLGGGNDSLFHFKAGFSKLRHPFHTWRLITDEDAYRRLSAARALSAPPAPATANATAESEAVAIAEFFPAYRRELAPAPARGESPPQGG